MSHWLITIHAGAATFNGPYARIEHAERDLLQWVTIPDSCILVTLPKGITPDITLLRALAD